MAVAQPQRWIIDWLLHNSMLHCKNSRPEIFQAFLLFIKNEVKVSINLERTIWHTMGNQSWNHAPRWVQARTDCRGLLVKLKLAPEWKKLLTWRPLCPFYDSVLPSVFFFFFFWYLLASNELARSGLFTAITQIFCLFLYLMPFFCTGIWEKRPCSYMFHITAHFVINSIQYKYDHEAQRL